MRPLQIGSELFKEAHKRRQFLLNIKRKFGKLRYELVCRLDRPAHNRKYARKVICMSRHIVGNLAGLPYMLFQEIHGAAPSQIGGLLVVTRRIGIVVKSMLGALIHVKLVGLAGIF